MKIAISDSGRRSSKSLRRICNESSMLAGEIDNMRRLKLAPATLRLPKTVQIGIDAEILRITRPTKFQAVFLLIRDVVA